MVSFKGTMTIDSFLAKIMYPFAPLLALSLRQRESLERPAIAEVSDEEWQSAVLTLIDHSSCIFCLPGRQNGIVWEIQRIVERADRLRNNFYFAPAKKCFHVENIAFGAQRAKKVG